MSMDRSKGEVWVFAEQEDGKIGEVPFELLGKARELGDKLGVKVGAVLMGKGVEALSARLFEGGADIVHLIDDEKLKVFRNKAYRHAMVELIKECAPQIVIFGATHMGRDLAPAVASALRCGLTADCTDLQIGEFVDKKTNEEFHNVLHQIRPAFGGNIIATIVNARHWPQMATVREGVMKPLVPRKGASGEIVRHSAKLDDVDIPIEVIEIVRKVSTVNLKGARVILTGGAGVGSKENFDMLFQLAKELHAEVGASRAAVDAGWVDHDRQIGQTGVTVRPKVYIACGISGQIQHIAGMLDSGIIISINSDPNAPINTIADYVINGTVEDVVPKLIKYYKQNNK